MTRGKAKFDLDGIASASVDSNLLNVINTRMTMDDIRKKHGNILPLAQLSKTTLNCIRKVLMESSKNGIPRMKRFEEESIWANTNVLESLEDLLLDTIPDISEGRILGPNKGKIHENMDATWTKFLNHEAIVKLIRYFEKNEQIKSAIQFRKFLNYKKSTRADELGVLEYRNAGAHFEGSTHSESDSANVRKLHSYQKQLYKYPSIIEELPRFFAVLGYIFRISVWFDNQVTDVNQAWNYLDLESHTSSSGNQHDHSRIALLRALDSLEWKHYIDKQNRLVGLMQDINSSKVIKIQGIGGLGKTALVYRTLRELVNDSQWNEHEFYSFTVKNKAQGEFTGEGLVNQIDYSILEYGASVRNMAHKLAMRNDERYEQGMTDEEVIDVAVDYMKQQECFVVIDNAEDIEYEQVDEKSDKSEFKLLKSFWDGVATLPPENRSRLIITSRFPTDYHGVNTVSAPFLNSEEIVELAKTRGDWYWQRWNAKNDDEQSESRTKIRRHVAATVNQSDWTEMSEWIRSKLGPKQKDTMGHPHFIIIATYEYSTTNELRFKDLLEKLVKEQISIDLEEYISSKSLDYIPEAYFPIVGLLALGPDTFSRAGIEGLVPADSLGMGQGIIDSLLDLNLVKESDHLRYAWVDYAKKEFSQRYRKSPHYQSKPRKERSHEIDKLNKSIKDAQDADADDLAAFEKVAKAAEAVESQSLSKDDRILGETVASQREFTHLMDSASEEQKAIVHHAHRMIDSRTAESLREEIDRRTSSLDNTSGNTTIIQGYIQLLSTTDWTEKLHEFDQHVSQLVSSLDMLENQHIWSAFEDLVIFRFNQNDELGLDDIVQLSVAGWNYMVASTQDRVIAKLADNRVASIDTTMRSKISEYVGLHNPSTLKTRLRFSTEQKSLSDLLDLLSMKWVDDEEGRVFTVNELTTRITDPVNYCSIFNLETYNTNTNKRQLIIDATKEHPKRIIVHHPHPGIRGTGTSSPTVFKLQHMYTRYGEAMTVIHVKFHSIEQNKTSEIRMAIKSEEQEPLESLPVEEKPIQKIDLREQYKHLLLRLLTHEPQLLSAYGNLVHQECLTFFGETGKEMRAKLWPENKKIKMLDACNKLLGDSVNIVEAKEYSTIALRR